MKDTVLTTAMEFMWQETWTITPERTDCFEMITVVDVGGIGVWGRVERRDTKVGLG